MKSLKLILLFLFVSHLHIAQIKRSNHWYFGYGAGINFSSGTPVVATGMVESIEGCAAISDLQGNLLFYSDGVKVWDKNHSLMPNGTGLFGDESSAQGCIIVPKPGSSTLYYLFTTAAYSPSKPAYSIIDMSLNNGNGDLTSVKNVTLFTDGTEELAATLHCDASSYWIIFREHVLNSLKFRAYPLTGAGLGSPVISTFNYPNPVWNRVGNISISQKGDKLVFNSFGSATYLFYFNNQTGALTYLNNIPGKTNEQVYSNALSPSGDKLYLTSWTPSGYSTLTQFDLTASNINATRYPLDSVDYTNGSPNAYGFISQIRLAPDQKIYVSRWHQKNPFVVNPNTYYSLDSLDVIAAPDLGGNSCGFQRNYLYLNHRPTMMSLPNFVSNFTDSTLAVSSCPVSTGFSYEKHHSTNSLFPNPSSGKINLMVTDASAAHTLIIYDHLGKLIKSVSIDKGLEKIELDLKLPQGVYFFSLNTNEIILQQGRLMIAE